MARANLAFIGVSLNGSGYNLQDWGWGVFCCAVMLAIIAIELDKLGKIHVCTKSPFDCFNVKPESVRGDLYAIGETRGDIVYKVARGLRCSLANPVRRNQFRFGI